MSLHASRPRRTHRLAGSLAVAAAAVLPASAYVGQWHSYPDMSRVTALVEHDGRVYAGTQGGIRRLNPATLAEETFDNLDGLLDPWIAAFARDSGGALWAVSRDGYVYDLLPGGARWGVTGRHYAALGWKMNDRAALAAGNFLYLGSQKGLSLFDTKNRIAQVNLTRFGNDLDVQVLSLLRRGDTLYAGTSAGVYKIRMFFSNPLNPPSGYANPADHSQWIKADLPPDPARRYDHLAFIGDSLATYGPGTLLQSPVRVEAFLDTPLVIGSTTYPSGARDYVSAVAAGGKIFVGGESGLRVHTPGGGADATPPPPKPHPRDTVMNLAANGGRVWAHSYAGLRAFDAAADAFTTVIPAPGSAGSIELYQRDLRNLKMDANGDAYVGTWGSGLLRIRNGATTAWDKSSAPCLIEPVANYAVVHALGQPRGGHLFFSMYKTQSVADHQLAHLNTETGTVNCLDDALPGGAPHAVEVFADTLVAVATDRGVNFVDVRLEGAVVGGVPVPTVESSQLWTLPGAANEAWDLAADHWGRPWALIGDQLAYLDSLETSTTRKLKPIESFSGTGCKHLEPDPAGALWIGCDNGLYRVIPDVTGAPLISVRRYGMDDGLPSLTIYDMSVDPSNGRVWVATDRGVAMLESGAQPAQPESELAAITPYPNPFRPQHAYVIFDRVPPGATLRIHEPAGRVIRIYHPADRSTGNQVQWDGKNERGVAVRPGVYLFSVTSGSKVQRGKVIVAR